MGTPSPRRRRERRGLRLWPVGTVLLLTFAAAVLVAAAVFYSAWDLLGAQGLKPERRIDSTTLFDLVKLSFGVVAGAGALVALVVAYRRQRLDEDGALREASRLHTERFTTAVSQLGDDSAAVRLGGVHALAGLADDAPTRELRQTCIDVLCAYLRLPYTAEADLPGDDAAARHAYVSLREVRHTVIRLVRDHLRLAPEHAHSWQEHDFDFTNVTFDGGDLSGAAFSGGSVHFHGATFSSGTVHFDGARFSGATVDFGGAVFSGSTVDFDGAVFSGGAVHFDGAAFSSGRVLFARAVFSSGTLSFDSAVFSGGTVSFGDDVAINNGAKFSGAMVRFDGAVFSGGSVHFDGATFSDRAVSFRGAAFSGGLILFLGAVVLSGGALSFDGATFSSGAVHFSQAALSGGTLQFLGARFSGGLVHFGGAVFSGCLVSFGGARFSSGAVHFSEATLSGSTLHFGRAAFSSGTVDFSSMIFERGAVDFREATGEAPPGLPTSAAWQALLMLRPVTRSD